MSTTAETITPAAPTTRTARPAPAAERDHYDPAETLRQARTRYFEQNGFGADGGYGDRWVKLKLGPIPYAVPNTAGRVRAVRYHDLHHIMTGYRTDWMGEFEISAWEVGSGCRDFAAAWFLDLGGMFGGMFLSPRRTYRAFVRGRHTRNLYGRTFDDALLDARVGEMRAELGLDRDEPAGTPADLARFVVYLLAGIPITALMTAPLLALVALAVWLLV